MLFPSKNILLCIDANPEQKFDLDLPKTEALGLLGNNSGNAVFQHVMHYLLTEHNNVKITSPFSKNLLSKQEIDKINSYFDAVVILPANVLATWGKSSLDVWSRNLSRKKKPIICVGLGAQLGRETIDDLCNEIKEEAVSFIRSILKNGKISTRGEITANFLKKLGFIEEQDFSVNGCPSMYLFGDSLAIFKREIDRLRPAFNGFRFWNEYPFESSFGKYPDSIFVCQEEFYNLLNRKERYSFVDKKYLWDPTFKFDTLNRDDRIKLYCSFKDWYFDLQKLKINFSFGCRIHGNVVPLLAGIPAFVDAFDSRTLELCKFFGIPHLDTTKEGHVRKNLDFEEIYNDLDFSLLNSSISSNFAAFKNFMVDAGLEIKPLLKEQFEKEENNNQIQGSLRPTTTTFKEEDPDNSLPFHILLVAHEFGTFKGNGGIASCLSDFVAATLMSKLRCKVTVVTLSGEPKKEFIENPFFKFIKVKGSDLSQIGNAIADIISKEKPNFVEFADYLGLGMETLLRKNETIFSSIVFSTDCHTASRECFLWSTRSANLPNGVRLQFEREKTQMFLSDILTSPSKFLSKYVEKNYIVPHVFHIPHVLSSLLPKDPPEKKVFPDLRGQFVVSNISRFEGRKNIEGLVKAFLQFLDICDDSAQLILAGTSSVDPLTGKDYRIQIMNLIPETKKENFLFFDYIGEEEKRKIYSASDLGVMASTFENFPVSLTEYVMNGVPVLCSKYCGSSDFMERPSGLKPFDPFEEGSLLAQMIHFYNMNVDERKKVADTQRRDLIDLTSFKRAVQDKIELFNSFEERSPRINSIHVLKTCRIPDNFKDNKDVLLTDDINLRKLETRLSHISFEISRIAKPLILGFLNKDEDFDLSKAIENGRPFLFHNFKFQGKEGVMSILEENKNNIIYIRSDCDSMQFDNSKFLKQSELINLNDLYE